MGIAASLAEICAVYPTAGGVYYVSWPDSDMNMQGTGLGLTISFVLYYIVVCYVVYP